MKRLNRFTALVALLAIWVCGLAYAATTTSGVSVQSVVAATASGTPGLGSLSFSMGSAATKSITFANGTGASQINKIYVATLATTTTIDLDSTLTDPVGNSVTFSRIAYVRVVAGTANAAAATIGGDWLVTKYLVPGGDTLANVTIPLNKLGFWEFAAPDATGIAITATTGDGLTVTLSGSDTATVVILGS